MGGDSVRGEREREWIDRENGDWEGICRSRSSVVTKSIDM